MNPGHYKAVIISPHLDDAVFSCGGEIARLTREGPVLVLNLFTRYTGQLRRHGMVLGDERHAEEWAAAGLLGYTSRNLDELDAPFRRPAYRSPGKLFGAPVREDEDWMSELGARVNAVLATLTFERLYVPLAVGWHVDHVIANRLFGDRADSGGIRYYEDLPYCLIPHALRLRLAESGGCDRSPGDATLADTGILHAWREARSWHARTAMMQNLRPWIVRRCAVPVVGVFLLRLYMAHRPRDAARAPERRFEAEVNDLGEALVARKVEAMMCYASQFREFFHDRDDCRAALAGYARRMGRDAAGVERYWRPRAA